MVVLNGVSRVPKIVLVLMMRMCVRRVLKGDLVPSNESMC